MYEIRKSNNIKSFVALVKFVIVTGELQIGPIKLLLKLYLSVVNGKIIL